jgi:hypothetical protein
VNFVDPSGLCVPLTPDVFLDVGFIGYDIFRLVADGRKGLGVNLTALGADFAGACTPIGTGFGLAVRAAKRLSEYQKHVRHVEEARQTLRALEKSLEAATGPKSRRPIQAEIAKVEKFIEGHLKEMRQKWPGGAPGE